MLSLLSFTAGHDIYWFYNPIPCVIKCSKITAGQNLQSHLGIRITARSYTRDSRSD